MKKFIQPFGAMANPSIRFFNETEAPGMAPSTPSMLVAG